VEAGKAVQAVQTVQAFEETAVALKHAHSFPLALPPRDGVATVPATGMDAAP
jgi:hypothetical protein